MGDGVADYPSHRELRRYFGDFADDFGLRERLPLRHGGDPGAAVRRR